MQTTPISDFHHFNDGRMDASPPTRELKTKVGYQKKRKMMVYPIVLAAAVKFYHGDQQDDKEIFPSSFGIYPEKKSETIDLETVVISNHIHMIVNQIQDVIDNPIYFYLYQQ
jgi:hypothetical protein